FVELPRRGGDLLGRLRRGAAAGLPGRGEVRRMALPAAQHRGYRTGPPGGADRETDRAAPRDPVRPPQAVVAVERGADRREGPGHPVDAAAAAGGEAGPAA